MSDEADELDGYLRDELPRIIKLVQNSRIRELEISAQSRELSIQRAQAPGAMLGPVELAGDITVDPIADLGPHLRTVSAPMVGVFYHSEQPGRAPLVEEGSQVERGSLIGVIEALQVLTEVESDVTGTVQRVVATDGQPVEFGQPLVEVLVEA